MALVTLAEVKTWLAITDSTQDALLTDLIAAVEDAILDFTETKFELTPVTNEIHDARRQDTLIPTGWPLASVQAVKLGVNADGTGGDTLAATEYNYDDVAVRLRASYMPLQRGYVRLDYTYGFATVPAKVKLATKLSVEAYYRMRKRGSVGTTSKAKEGESISYDKSWSSSAGLPNEAVALLESYRKVEFPTGPGTAMATRNI